MIFILSAIYFYLPGGFANIGANLGKYIPIINKLTAPIDRAWTFRGKRLVGEHKKWSGLVFGVLLGIFVGIVKYIFLDPVLPGLAILNLTFINNLFLSFIMSAGALLGDLVKSFVKRQFKIPAHVPWIPFDEIDHTTIAMLLVKVFYNISWKLVFVTIVIIMVLHFISNVVGYFLHIKKVPY